MWGMKSGSQGTTGILLRQMDLAFEHAVGLSKTKKTEEGQ